MRSIDEDKATLVGEDFNRATAAAPNIPQPQDPDGQPYSFGGLGHVLFRRREGDEMTIFVGREGQPPPPPPGPPPNWYSGGMWQPGQDPAFGRAPLADEEPQEPSGHWGNYDSSRLRELAQEAQQRDRLASQASAGGGKGRTKGALGKTSNNCVRHWLPG